MKPIHSRTHRMLTLNTGLLLIILIFGSCSDRGQKAAPKESIETPEEVPEPPVSQQRREGTLATPEASVEAQQNALENTSTSKIYMDPATNSLEPWYPIDVPSHIDEIEEASIERFEAEEISIDEHLEAMYDIYVAELNAYTFVRELYPRGGPYAGKYEIYLERALAANPNDFETLYTWAEIGGKDLQSPLYGPEKAAAYRRLHEMNPNHPFVLHRLAQCLYAEHPEEALGYAQKAQALEPRFIPHGLDGVCYFQMGDYEKALSAFKRAHAAAPEALKYGTYERVQRVTKSINSSKLQETQQRKREVGIRLMGPYLPRRRH